jgi:hypothetical protein
MPIYLVRWPDLSAALVKASSEDELVEILDEVANPDGSTWSVYRGPLFLEFSLPVRFDVKDRGGRAGPILPEEVAPARCARGGGGTRRVSTTATNFSIGPDS